MKYSVDKPYPQIMPKIKSNEYVDIILDLYTSEISEETAIHLYFYQSLILPREYQNILENISKVEMHHLEILGVMIRELGGDPKFVFNNTNNNPIYWSSGNVNYEKDVIEIFKNNIKAEMLAIRNYQNAIRLINNGNIKDILNRIIDDEKVHVQIFENILLELEKRY